MNKVSKVDRDARVSKVSKVYKGPRANKVFKVPLVNLEAPVATLII